MKTQAKKVFNNEDEFGIILNKRWMGRDFQRKNVHESDFLWLESALKEFRWRCIYKSVLIYIQIVFVLYINRFSFVYRSYSVYI
ncbi:hypothetical protein HQ50_00040 [Porphyromonas sp. COT-052 OH4946]|nr:hypothetical protein HQ50_00040 [Porphyromonas sp. COT-052 OH4946]